MTQIIRNIVHFCNKCVIKMIKKRKWTKIVVMEKHLKTRPTMVKITVEIVLDDQKNITL